MLKHSNVEYTWPVCCEYRMLYLLDLVRVRDISCVMILFCYVYWFRIAFCSEFVVLWQPSSYRIRFSLLCVEELWMDKMMLCPLFPSPRVRRMEQGSLMSSESSMCLLTSV